MVFAARNDITTKIITAVIALVAFTGLILPLFLQDEDVLVTLPVGLILTAVLIVCWLFKPRYYELTAAGLLIKRPIGTVKIGQSRIESVGEAERKKLRFAIRTFGIGGVFGYFGSFYTGFYGNMTWYITDMSNPIMIITKDKKKILLSPGEKEFFIAELKKLID